MGLMQPRPRDPMDCDGGELDSIEFLRAVSLFDEIKERHEVLSSLAGAMETRRYRAGEAILREGDAGAEMFLLTRGHAWVTKKTHDGDSYHVVLLRAEDHAFFGEGALLDAEARSATIVAESACLCLVLSRKAFQEFGQAHPQWAYPVLQRIARDVLSRLRKSNEDLMLLYHALISEIRGV